MTRPHSRLLRATVVCAGAVGLLVATGGAQSAGDTTAWTWQAAVSNGRPTRLISIGGGTGVISLAAVGDGREASLAVRTDDRTVQQVAASSISVGQPLVAFVIAERQGSETVVGVARQDVARVFLIVAANSRELPLNAAGAFAAAGTATGASLRLQAFGADGSTIGVLDLPRTRPACAGAAEPCQTATAATNGLRMTQRAAGQSGTIRWLLDHELRGLSLEASGIPLGSTVGSHWQTVRFARVLAPNPGSRARIVLSLIGKRGRNICLTVFPAGAGSSGGGCAVGPTLTPLSVLTSYGPGGGYLAGAAADRVARIVMRVQGEGWAPVPLKDNVFFVRVRPGETPRSLVSFDHAGKLIASQALPHVPLPRIVQALAATPRYTVSNRGRLIADRSNHFFQGQRHQIFLLGTIGGRDYYRVQLTPHYTCWGSGPSDKIGVLGVAGCPTVVGAYPLQLDDNDFEAQRGTATPHALRLAGIVADQATSVALRDPNGKTLATVPVEHNLFAFSPPLPSGFLRPVPLDANGQPLPPHPEWGQHQTPPPNFLGPRATKISPSQLGTVVQRGEAKGVTVSADQNGDVVFDARSISPSARRALGKRIAWFSCFQIDGQNVRHNRSAGISAPLTPLVALKTVGIKPRYDGCEAGGSYGHRWHDHYGPHSTLEIPLTQQGGRYFEDRATARDLAAFVRSAKTQAIRRRTGAALIVAIRADYGSQISVLSSASATGPPGQVGVWTRGNRTVFSERSHLGDKLYVEFDDGKIVHQNVRGLALVF